MNRYVAVAGAAITALALSIGVNYAAEPKSADHEPVQLTAAYPAGRQTISGQPLRAFTQSLDLAQGQVRQDLAGPVLRLEPIVPPEQNYLESPMDLPPPHGDGSRLLAAP